MVIATTTALLIKSKKKRTKTIWETSLVRIRDNNYSVSHDWRVLRGRGDHGELPWMVPDHPLILAAHHSRGILRQCLHYAQLKGKKNRASSSVARFGAQGRSRPWWSIVVVPLTSSLSWQPTSSNVGWRSRRGSSGEITVERDKGKRRQVPPVDSNFGVSGSSHRQVRERKRGGGV
ncbi:hypothetical protein Sjap_003051 [Stephania japonica]|uniref:Uncharacterized protein n=1 Tax=Stephania japonica TaxID=461633 RepID=A0AAP0KN04_9MAGN